MAETCAKEREEEEQELFTPFWGTQGVSDRDFRDFIGRFLEVEVCRDSSSRSRVRVRWRRRRGIGGEPGDTRLFPGRQPLQNVPPPSSSAFQRWFSFPQPSQAAQNGQSKVGHHLHCLGGPSEEEETGGECRSRSWVPPQTLAGSSRRGAGGNTFAGASGDADAGTSIFTLVNFPRSIIV